jgi:hypothetical protein
MTKSGDNKHKPVMTPPMPVFLMKSQPDRNHVHHNLRIWRPGETHMRKITRKCWEMTEKKGKEMLPSAHNQQRLAKSANMVR